MMTEQDFREIMQEHVRQIKDYYMPKWAKTRSGKMLQHFKHKTCGNRKRRRTSITKYLTKIN